VDFYEEWNKKYLKARADLNNREELIKKCLLDLE